MRIGVIGLGMVGKAVYTAFSYKNDVVGYDVDESKSKNELSDLDSCEVIFVCVPTPTTKDGVQDIKPLEDVCARLQGFKGVLCVKCTVLPGVLELLQSAYQIRITHNPEFLTERAAFQDFCNQQTVIISGKLDDTSVVAEAYETIMPKAEILVADEFTTTVLAKYMSNCFLAMKVVWNNEFYDICEKFGANYHDVAQLAASQGLIGKNHLKVPGPDGQRGFGGSCFPKDTAAFAHRLAACGIRDTLIHRTIETNKKWR